MEILHDSAAAVRPNPVSGAPAAHLLPGVAQLMSIPQICSQSRHVRMRASTHIKNTRPSSAPCRGSAGQSSKTLSADCAQHTAAATAQWHHPCATVVLPNRTSVTSRSSSNTCSSMALQQATQRPVEEIHHTTRVAAPAMSTAQQHCNMPLKQQNSHNAFMRAWRNRVNSNISLNQQSDRASMHSHWYHHGSRYHQDRHQHQQPAAAESTGICLTSSKLQQQLSRLQWGITAGFSTDWPATPPLSRSAPAAGPSATPASPPASSSCNTTERVAAGNNSANTVQLSHSSHHGNLNDSQNHAARAEAHQGLADNNETSQRMFDRWQARSISTAGNDMLLDVDTQYAYAIWVSTLEGSHHGSLVSASGSHEIISTTAPACAASMLAARAAQLLDQCTVQSSKKQPENCCICLDDMHVNELAPLLMCGHRMHRGCLIRWLTQRLAGQVQEHHTVVCPLCKQVSVDRAVLGSL